VDSWCGPDGIVMTHGANQFANCLGNARPPQPATSNVPGPEQAEAFRANQ
jgi:hypothetical protein